MYDPTHNNNTTWLREKAQIGLCLLQCESAARVEILTRKDTGAKVAVLCAAVDFPGIGKVMTPVAEICAGRDTYYPPEGMCGMDDQTTPPPGMNTKLHDRIRNNNPDMN